MAAKEKKEFEYDYVVIGSGFGGSASALRLSEKGYKVLVIEKGRWFTAKDFPKRNWNIKRWLWIPFLRFHGFFKITLFKHITTLSGVGVGGGSLVYANTLPVPKSAFFNAPSWAHLANWEKELKPFYEKARMMMGVTRNPNIFSSDFALKKLAHQIGREKHYTQTDVAVFFGEENETVDDPYFDGEGPPRAGCNFCAGCMVGCRYNAKNTLDKNYLHLAQNNGAEIKAESLVYDVIPLDNAEGKTGYKVKWQSSTKWFSKKDECKTKGVVFAGGALGTLDLLLDLKKSSLPRLSDKIGYDIRTNSESLIGVTTFNKDRDFAKGVTIGSILQTDENSHLETVVYPSGSGFWRLFMSPLVHGPNLLIRIWKILLDYFLHPVKNLRAFFVRDWAKRTQILLFMQTLDSTLRFSKNGRGLNTSLVNGQRPTAFIRQAKELSEQFAKNTNGKPYVLLSETILGNPTTAHILGGAVMGKDLSDGVIDKNNKVFGYKNMFICDGSAISANPGVNPSLTILAITERAMSKVRKKRGS
jgi:cholesterol oxidase